MGDAEPTPALTHPPEVEAVPPTSHDQIRGSKRRHLSLDEHAERSQVALPEPSTTRRTRAVSRQLLTTPFSLSVIWGGRRQELTLLDISNQGLKVRAPPDLDIAEAVPGRRLSDISITTRGVEVLGRVEAVVRRVSTSAITGNQGFELGLELIPERRAKRPEASFTEFAKSTERITEVLEDALRSGLSIGRLDSTSEPVQVTEGSVDAESGVLRLDASLDADIRTGDPVRVTCEVSGFNCWFFTSVDAAEEDGSFSLKLPRVIKMRRARNLHRLRPAEGNHVELKFRSPFDLKSFRTNVLDINSSGASFFAERSAIALPVGTILDPMELIFVDGRTTAVRGQVRSLSAATIGGAAPGFRYGIEFEALSDEVKELLADDVVRSVRPSLFNTNGVTYEELWRFFEQSGFLYPEKLEHLQDQLPEIRETYARLLDEKQTQVLKTFFCKRDGIIQGHVSSLRLYRQTSYVQHIAVIRQPQSLFATEVLSLGMSEYLEQMPQFEWCRMFFRPNNRWPARVFGTFAKKLNVPSFSDLRTLSFCAGSTNGASPALAPGSAIHRAQQTHLEQIQHHFVALGRTILLQSNDLSLDHLPMREIESIYAANGLTRRREILVLEKGTTFLGFALLEISSPGLNLSELTNHFSVHVEEGGSTSRRLLIAAARDRYRELGRKGCIALHEGDGLEDFEAMGLPKKKEYLCWTGHRSLMRSYSEYVLGLFGRYT
jgi:hypothetical protein